jgi:hypothetical protein
VLSKIVSVVWAGVAAVLAANFVLVGYVVLAMLEEEAEVKESGTKYAVFEDRDGMAEEFSKEKLQ